MRRILLGAAAAWVALVSLGARCGGGDGGGGSPPVVQVESPDSRCLALTSQFPAGFDFVPGLAGQVLITNEEPQSILRFDVQDTPFRVPGGASSFTVPVDSDGDGRPEGASPPFGIPFSPVLDDVDAIDAGLALVTASGYEEVLFVDASVSAVTIDLQVPVAIPPGLYPFLPPPGAGGARTGVSTFACPTPLPGALDSRGAAVDAVIPVSSVCPAGAYEARFTSGAALSAGRLFVTTSNPGADLFTANTQYLPGTVLVFDVDRGTSPPVVRPHPGTPILFTTGFNPSHATAYRTPGGRDLVLVSVTGAIGIQRDDPATPALEGGGVGLTDGAVDVIDPSVPAVIATIPLRSANPAFGELAIDPTGRIAFVGDAVRRNLYAVDLQPLDGLGAPGATPIVLDGSAGPNAIVFDGTAPFRIPPIANGAPSDSCAGFTSGVAVNDAGDRVYVIEQCDGTLATVLLDLSGAPPVPVPAARFRLARLESVAAPLREDTFGLARQPGSVRVRPGIPGVDFQGPDVFLTIGTPEGLLCGLRIESP